ncbi:MAG TPA: hypothetical protein VMW30_02485 [Candidatus Paceibacterota bacterium]|nr:hypothetical protein [Candidatus Paceibacterota bacterium]
MALAETPSDSFPWSPPSIIPMSGIIFPSFRNEDGELLSARTVQYHASILKKALSYAVEVDGLLAINPAKKVQLPKGTPRRLDPFTREEAKKFLEALNDHRLFAFFRLAIYSGARKGELLTVFTISDTSMRPYFLKPGLRLMWSLND